MCPIVKVMEKYSEVETVVCVTGQHKELLKQVLDVFHVLPDYNLEVMKTSQTLFDITTSILTGMRDILEKEKPDIVLVHGDTSTAFATALASFYCKIPVGHVEAGLRTNNIYSPYPEEFNRQAVDILAKYYFAPTVDAKENLISEGKSIDNIFVTGNTVIDALKYTVDDLFEHEELKWAEGSRMIIVTAHRRENIGKPMRSMFKAIRRITMKFPDVKVVFPMHMNPIVRDIVNEELNDCEQIHLIEPLSVEAFHNFMAKSYLILTDSGGIQEEASALKKPVLVMRAETERMEGVKTGVLKLVGTDEERIYEQCSILLENPAEYSKMCNADNPYGNGQAAEIITNIIREM